MGLIAFDEFLDYLAIEVSLDREVLAHKDFSAMQLDSVQLIELYVTVEELGCELDLDAITNVTDARSLYSAYVANVTNSEGRADPEGR